MDVSIWAWVALLAVVLVMLAVDLLMHRDAHEIGVREAAVWSAIWVGIGLAVGGVIWVVYGSEFGLQYLAGYVIEKSLAVDNVFVWALILSYFAVPKAYQHRVLFLGVIGALVFRAIFIAIGAAAISAFAFTFVIFGAILIWTGVQLARHRNEDPDPMDNFIIRRVRSRVPFTDEYDGTRMFTKIDARRVATPLLLVMISIGATDLLFALDSIPATFGVTQDPYLVFTANAFALLGLRALYFLLKGLLDKLVYLSTGLAVILVFIGIKLVITFFHEQFAGVPKISTEVSLGFIAIVLVIVVIASWLKVRKDPEATAHAGRLTSGHDEPDSEK